MAKVIKAPKPYSYDPYLKFVFLGGSIEMGAAENWQDKFEKDFKDEEDVVFLNPRRDDWNSDWKQIPEPGTDFYAQVDWELNAQERSDIIVYYFDSNTKSPITLLELGLFGIHNNVIVRCAPDFYRYGNVKMVCDRYEIPIVHTYKELVQRLKEELE